MPEERDTEKDLETLRRLGVDLGKDGHTELGERAAAVHNLIQKLNEKSTEGTET